MPDFQKLEQFYLHDIKGQIFASKLQNTIAQIWPYPKRDKILTIGCIANIVGNLAVENQIVPIIINHKAQDEWNGNRVNGLPNTILSKDFPLPLADCSINKVIIMHTIEHLECAEILLKEILRILVPGGKVIVVVPNKISFGAVPMPFQCADDGFTIADITALLSSSLLPVQKVRTLLCGSSKLHIMMPSMMKFVDHFAAKLFFPLSGVLIVESAKMLMKAKKAELRTLKTKKIIFHPTGYASNQSNCMQDIKL